MNDSRTKNKVTDFVKSDIDVVFVIQSLYVVLQSMLKLWLIEILKFWCFTNHTNDKIWQKMIRDKHMSSKVRYDREENLAQSHMSQIVNHEQMKMQSCSCYFFISQKRK